MGRYDGAYYVRHSSLSISMWCINFGFISEIKRGNPLQATARVSDKTTWILYSKNEETTNNTKILLNENIEEVRQLRKDYQQWCQPKDQEQQSSNTG